MIRLVFICSRLLLPLHQLVWEKKWITWSYPVTLFITLYAFVWLYNDFDCCSVCFWSSESIHWTCVKVLYTTDFTLSYFYWSTTCSCLSYILTWFDELFKKSNRFIACFNNSHLWQDGLRVFVYSTHFCTQLPVRQLQNQE